MILTLERWNLDDDFGANTELVRNMSEYYTEQLMIGMYDVMVNVVMHDEIKVEGLDGYCEWDPIDKVCEVHIAMKGPEWGITLAHEFVHVQQNLEYGISSKNIVLSEQEAYKNELQMYYDWKSRYYLGHI